MKKILLVFDLDGTLLDSRHDLCTGINLMRRHYGLQPLPETVVAGYVGDGVSKLVQRSLQGAPINLNEALEINIRFYLEHMFDRTVPYHGVVSGLKQLAHAGADMAVISNKLHEPTLALLEHFNLAPLFSMALGGGQIKPKPHPEGIQRVMRTLGYSPDKTWMIGDSANDLGTARAAGAHGIYLTYGYTPAAPEIPELTFDNFPGLTEYFLAHHLPH